MSHFSLSYRRPPGDWIQVASSVEPQKDYLLNDLLPDTEYVIKVVAHNSAGFTPQEYVFNTLGFHGGNFVKCNVKSGEIMNFCLLCRAKSS